jgi:hypothetical protein
MFSASERPLVTVLTMAWLADVRTFYHFSLFPEQFAHTSLKPGPLLMRLQKQKRILLPTRYLRLHHLHSMRLSASIGTSCPRTRLSPAATFRKALATGISQLLSDWWVLSSDSQIEEQMNVLNQDYIRTGLLFRLEKINRAISPVFFYSVDDGNLLQATMKALYREGNNSALNVYTVR